MGQRIDQYRIRLRSLDRVVSEAAISPARRSPRQFKVKYDPTRTGLATPRRDDPSNRNARGSPRHGAGRLNNSNSTLSGEALQGLNLNGSDSAQRPRSAQGRKLFQTSKPSPSISSQHSPMLSSRKSLTPKRSLDVPTAPENESARKQGLMFRSPEWSTINLDGINGRKCPKTFCLRPFPNAILPKTES